MSPMSDLDQILPAVSSGDKKAVSRLFNLLEDRRAEKIDEVAEALDKLYLQSLDRSHVIGITGPPGAGKSSLLSRLIQHLREKKKSVGILAIDPSSKISGGALLGDRIRLQYDASDPGVFVRSMASRGEYGGVSDRTFAGTIVLRSAFDVVFVETVGVGQSESEIAGFVDSILLVIQPGSGDILQFLKAGIMELPHVLAVNKMDLGEPAQKTLHEVRAALGHLHSGESDWQPKALGCSALDGKGIAEIIDVLGRHREHLTQNNLLEKNRTRQSIEWIAQSLRAMFGHRGVEKSGATGELENSGMNSPFETMQKLITEIDTLLYPASKTKE